MPCQGTSVQGLPPGRELAFPGTMNRLLALLEHTLLNLGRGLVDLTGFADEVPGQGPRAEEWDS